jgi:hypothetical protein
MNEPVAKRLQAFKDPPADQSVTLASEELATEHLAARSL